MSWQYQRDNALHSIGNTSSKAFVTLYWCATRQCFWGPSRYWEQVMLPEVAIRVPPGIREHFVKVEEVGSSTETRISSPLFHFPAARRAGHFEVKTWMWCPLFHHNSYSFILQLTLLPLPINLNHAPRSVFSLPIPEDWLIIKHATSHPLYSHPQVSEHCDGMFSKFWCKATGCSEGGQDSSSSYTYTKASPCFIQHTEMAIRPLQIPKPSMKVFGFFFLHRKLNTKNRF